MDWTLIEVVWTLVASFGAYYSIQNIREANKDLKLLDDRFSLLMNRAAELKWQIAHVVARGTKRREIIRSIVHSFFVILGFASAFTPSPNQPSAGALLAGYLFIVASALLSLSTRNDNVDRKEMVEIGALLIVEEGTNGVRTT